MKITPFVHYNMWYVLPMLSIVYEKNYYLCIDIAWLKWGISIVLKNK